MVRGGKLLNAEVEKAQDHRGALAVNGLDAQLLKLQHVVALSTQAWRGRLLGSSSRCQEEQGGGEQRGGEEGEGEEGEEPPPPPPLQDKQTP